MDSTPDEPLIFDLDQSLLHQLGWHVGDRLTLIPIELDRASLTGKLIIRRARPDEPSIVLPDFVTDEDRAFPDPLPLYLRTPKGPRFEWSFPTRWVETFFPLQFETVAREFFPVDYSRSLAVLLDQEGELILALDGSKLYLILQRTRPYPGTLDVRLIPGLFHFMGWSPETPLVLESASRFNPAVKSDVLTIRRTDPGETPSLAWDGRKMAVEVPPRWLKQLLPRHHDPSRAEGSPYTEEWFELAEVELTHPDTSVVRFNAIEIRSDALSFEVTLPADPF